MTTTRSVTPTTRKVFMDRVHQALGRSQTPTQIQIPPAIDESIARLVQSSEDINRIFIERAAATGMIVESVSRSELGNAVLKFLKAESAVRVGMAVASDLDIAAELEAGGIELVSEGDRFKYDAGITDVQGAVAETGTLLCASDSTPRRSLSLVVPLHVAIVRKSDIVADHLDYWNAQTGSMPSSLSLITGPSKTADIEGILVTGVHGPSKVFILVIQDA